MQTIELTKHSKLVEFSHALSAAANDLERYPVLKEHAAAFNSLAHDLLLPPIVVVMGAFNAGKSTLLNAMLGQNLLNMHVLPATATVTMLRKGTSGAFYGHTDGQPVRKWPASDLVSLSAEGDTAAADIRRSLSYIEVPLEVPLLDKVTLVDTPGLNSPNEAHTRATEEFVHRAHTVLWIVSCLSALNEHERSWIEGLPDGLKVMVVVNQIDLLDPEENSLPRVIERIQNNLQRPDLTVTAVSAKLALESRLQANPKIYAESLWDRFEADFNSQIMHSDFEPQLQLAIRKAAALFESVDADIAKYLSEADGLRIKAKGGNEYHQDLQNRIGKLAGAEHSLVHAFDAANVVKAFKIPLGWNIPKKLQLQQEVLVGALNANDSEQSQINHEQKSLEEKRELCKIDYRQLQADVEVYKKSGLFGGEPVIFDGKKKKLESREIRINARSEALRSEQEAIRTKQQFLNGRLRRVKDDCSAFVAELVMVLRATMSAVVKESHDTIGQQKIAAQKLGELKWLPAFALETRQKPYWTLKEWGETAESEEPAGMYLRSALLSLSETNDRILAETWSLSIPQPLIEPDALKGRHVHYPQLRIESGAISKSLWALALLVVIGVIVFFSMRHTAQSPIQQTKVEEPLPKPSASSVAVVPMDDQTSIRAALIAEGYVTDGGMTDIPGLEAGVTIHSQKVSCPEGKLPCEKLFFFAGPRAVWSEDLASSDAVTALNVIGPGQLDVQFKSLLPDGTEGSNLVRYKWDGERLSRTEDAANAPSSDSAEAANGDLPPNQVATVEPSKNATEDVAPTADALNRQGVAFANSRQYDLAISLFTKAMTLNAGQAELYNNRGTAFDGKGDFRRAIQDYDEAIKRNGNYPEAYFNRANAFAKLGDYPRAIADYDEALRLKPTFTEATIQRRAVMLRQTPLSQSGQQNPAQSYPAPVQRNTYTATAPPKYPSAYVPRNAQVASLDDTLQAARTALQRKDLRGAYRLATQALDSFPNSVEALELIQVILAEGGDPSRAETAALDAINHGGKAVFELQHFHAWPTGLHAARLVITAGSLEFVPEAPCKYADFTIPLASIKSIDMGENMFNAYLLNIKFDDSHERKGKESKGQISFSDSSSTLNTLGSVYRVSSRRSMPEQAALFSAIRDTIVNAKGQP